MIAINKKKKMLNMESSFVAERYSMLGTGREKQGRQELAYHVCVSCISFSNLEHFKKTLTL